MSSFDDILTHEFGEFLTFCRSRHAEESVLFWNTVEAFRKRSLALEMANRGEHLPSIDLIDSNSSPRSTKSRTSIVDIVKSTGKSLVSRFLHEISLEEKSDVRNLFFQNKENFSSSRKLETSMQENMASKLGESEEELQCFSLAREIYFVFLDPSTSKQCICLTGEMLREIETQLNSGHVTHTLYDEPQKVILAEMRANLLPEYIEQKKQRLFPEHFNPKRAAVVQ